MPKGPTLAVLPAADNEASDTGLQILQPSGWNVAGELADGFVAQVRQALSNISAIMAEGGARPEHLVRLTWYVVDIEEYLVNLKSLGQVYREIFGSHYPAMALVQVVRLVEKAARVEIEATAVVPR